MQRVHHSTNSGKYISRHTTQIGKIKMNIPFTSKVMHPKRLHLSMTSPFSKSDQTNLSQILSANAAMPQRCCTAQVVDKNLVAVKHLVVVEHKKRLPR